MHSSYGSGIWVAAGHFISRLSNLKISCPPPAEAVHAAAIPFTEILRGFSSWNPDTSGDARNEKSVMHVPCIRYGLAHDICGTVAVGIDDHAVKAAVETAAYAPARKYRIFGINAINRNVVHCCYVSL